MKKIVATLSICLLPLLAQATLPVIDYSAVANLIRENNISQIKSAIQTGGKDGMVTMENSIKALVKEGWIEEETAQKRIGKTKKA